MKWLVWLVNGQHALDHGNNHLRGWQAAGGNITSDQVHVADVAEWSAAMCKHASCLQTGRAFMVFTHQMMMAL